MYITYIHQYLDVLALLLPSLVFLRLKKISQSPIFPKCPPCDFMQITIATWVDCTRTAVSQKVGWFGMFFSLSFFLQYIFPSKTTKK